MCGIVGFVDCNGFERQTALATVERMAAMIRHRGPDDHGAWCDPDVGVVLGHRRLAIIDLSAAGHQPMISADGRYIVIMNGEIYNHRELRKELERDGYPFRGHSDTEVAVAAFQRYGVPAGLERFVGMFAFAVYDCRQRVLFLARDRIGEKPLYYGETSDGFAFASELKALRAYPGWSPDIDRDALGLLLQHGYIPTPRTIYTGVRKLAPGTWLAIRIGRRMVLETPRAFWSAERIAMDAVSRERSLDPAEAVTEVETVLRRSVADMMISDVPLGAFLSGGIDSSTIVALMQAQSTDKVKTFSIGFHEPEYNEADQAKEVAKHLATDHTEIYVSPEQTLAVIPKIPLLYDEPFADSSQVPTYLVSEIARRRVTVALSGDGGDELFGGYTRYFAANDLWQAMNRVPGPLRAFGAGVVASMSPTRLDRIVGLVRAALPYRWRYKQLGSKLRKLAAMSQASSPDAVYRQLISLWTQPSDIVIGAENMDILAPLSATLSKIPDFTERMMFADLVTYLPDDILVKVDRASMAHSLEVRVPFLDHRVVESAWQLPLATKISGGAGKWILRQILYRYVPRELVDRPKMGFGVPIDEWLRGPLRDWAESLLSEQRLQQEGFFHPQPIREKWNEHVGGKAAWHYYLWPILMFQAWLEEYEPSH